MGDMLRRNDVCLDQRLGNSAMLGDSQSRQLYLTDTVNMVWGHLLQNIMG